MLTSYKVAFLFHNILLLMNLLVASILLPLSKFSSQIMKVYGILYFDIYIPPKVLKYNISYHIRDITSRMRSYIRRQLFDFCTVFEWCRRL